MAIARGKLVQVRVTEAEKVDWERVAGFHGLPVSGWLRHLASRAVREARQSGELERAPGEAEILTSEGVKS